MPAVGYAVDGGTAGWWVYTGDTGPNPALWERLATMKVAHLVIETAFGDDERQLARISRHLCPAALGHELQQLAGSVDVHITHIKPGERDAVMAEIGKLGSPHKIRALEIGDVMRLDRRAEARLRLSRPGRAGATVTECVSSDPIGRKPAAIGDRLCQRARVQFTVFGRGGVAWPLQ